jgi:hypothetical protein
MYMCVCVCVCVDCTVLKRLTMPSGFHIPLPSNVPFAHSETPFTHGWTYSVFPASSGTTSFFPSFRFPVDHNFWQSHWVDSLKMSIPNELFSGYVIQRARENCVNILQISLILLHLRKINCQWASTRKPDESTQ